MSREEHKASKKIVESVKVVQKTGKVDKHIEPAELKSPSPVKENNKFYVDVMVKPLGEDNSYLEASSGLLDEENALALQEILSQKIEDAWKNNNGLFNLTKGEYINLHNIATITVQLSRK